MFTEETRQTLLGFGFTAKQVCQIEQHGWIRHSDSARFSSAMLKAAEAGWNVTPPDWPNSKDPDSGWYVNAPKGTRVYSEKSRYSRSTREGI